jgi:uncharacterized membrane protein YdbT with pleckstrin-like domain
MGSYFKQNLKEGEEPILVLRKHWASFTWPVGRTVLFIGATLPFLSFIFTYQWLALVVIIWWAVVLVWLVVSWFTWYFNITIVTSLRIIDIEQRGLLMRRVREAPHEWISEITFEIKGLLATIFGFGNVMVSLGGDKKNITIEAVASPEIIKDKLIKIQEFIQYSGGQRELSAKELVEFIQKAKNQQSLSAKSNSFSEIKVKVYGARDGTK